MRELDQAVLAAGVHEGDDAESNRPMRHALASFRDLMAGVEGGRAGT
jgi:hypothetical protein